MDLLPEVTLADDSPELANALKQDATFNRAQDAAEQATCAERQFREWNRAREDAHRHSFPEQKATGSKTRTPLRKGSSQTRTRRFKRGPTWQKTSYESGFSGKSKDDEDVSGPIAQKGEPTGQTVKRIHPNPATAVKERILVARAKEKKRTKVTKESPLTAEAASSTGDQANASPGAYEAAVPDWVEWHEDSYYADPGWTIAMPHTTNNCLTGMQRLP